ncbi:MAG TPA: hypothetical protein VF982_06595 [Anaerolineales bacterium]
MRESLALGAVRNINDCANRYATAHPEEGFPANLGALGPAGTGCLQKRFVNSKDFDYEIHYTPGRPNDQAIITTYTVTARPIRYGRSGVLGHFSNESGVVRTTREERAATAEDPPI